MFKDKGETYDPSEDGFVFSEVQIAAARIARSRENRIDEALDYRETAA